VNRARFLALRCAYLGLSVPTRIFELCFWLCAGWLARLDSKIQSRKAQP